MQTHESFSVVSAGGFITRIGVAVILLFAVAGTLPAADLNTELPVLIEAEGFANTGGWVVDPQFMDLMGSPYLLAHGLGVPVNDARTVLGGNSLTRPKIAGSCVTVGDDWTYGIASQRDRLQRSSL
jgi:hypothetical protein